MLESTIRAVVFQEGQWWIIQGLEYGFATYTERLEEVPGELRRWLLVLFAASQKYGIKPFTNYSPAPRRFWTMYEMATPWPEPIPFIELPEDFGPGWAVEARLVA